MTRTAQINTHPLSRRRRNTLGGIVIGCIWLMCGALSAQSLARPGWSGSGLTVEPWYRHAVLYTVDPHRYTPAGTLAALTARLDFIRSLGVDAVVITHLDVPGADSLDDLDTMMREAARDNLRVLIALPSSATPEQARLFLSHNAAGLALSAEASPQIRDLIHGFPGKRILFAPGGDLNLDTSLVGAATDATSLRRGLEALEAAAAASVAQSPPTLPPELAAPVLLATHANAELYAGQELGLAPATPVDPLEAAKQDADPGSLLNWFRSLIDNHHGSSALRSGSITFLNRDADNALVWIVRRPQITPQSPAIVVLCNLADKPVKLSLTSDLAALHLRGTFLRPVLRSSAGMGGQSLDAVTLPPHATFIGELRF